MSVGCDQLVQAIADCRRFIGPTQMRVMLDACRSEEGEWFKAKLVALALQFEHMPKTGETDVPYEARVRQLEDEGLSTSDAQGAADVEAQRGPTVQMHYFVGSADWFVVERDVTPEQLQAYGYADLFGDSGELGYIDLVEITRCGAELDLHWRPRPLNEVLKERSKR